jgi:serine/threonine-protein kinase
VSDDDVTSGPSTSDATRVARSSAGAAPPPSTPTRFAPGSIIAGRYRLVALIGRGGMGEVYRAEDLTLDQPVALKFLPEHVAADPVHLAQFHNELRVARQVSHKNVCRLYDLGDADGRRFLTMEYVDGEDLASLLRRIGRIPEDKAIELARQLCAGLAAAHERGVLHRDLKPANVMIDGDGNVRLTDFGLAMAATDVDAIRAGTPQYMAPEQLISPSGGSGIHAGPLATVKTDIYALGLVLFEIFTGRRAYEEKAIPDLVKLHESGSIATPSAIVRDLDPAVERTIMRCLERDPARRPASALVVAAALPGGDPLAAALAAGETPSPDLLAAAGETEAIGVGRGVATLAFVVIGALAVAALSPRASIVGRVPLDKPPAVLADRAQDIVRSLGYTDPAADSASNFLVASDYLRWISESDHNPRRWDALKSGRPPALLFWYRTSPRLLVPGRSELGITPTDPPLTVSGMTVVVTDTQGRLQQFNAVPAQVDRTGAPAVSIRWEPLFDAAGLSMSAFTPVTPEWTPRTFADERAAWEGPLPDRPGQRVRVEAAAYRGRPVSLIIVGPWSRPTQMQAVPRSAAQSVVIAAATLLLVALIATATLLARRNVRARRADVRGAWRIALSVIVGYSISWLLAAHHVSDVSQEVNAFLASLGTTLVAAALLWVTYVAVEPYVRRFWPDGILGWTRLMSGYVRDSRVGRDVLAGCVFGVGLTLLELAYDLLPPLVGRTSAIPRFQSEVETLSGVSVTAAQVFDDIVSALFVGMFAVLGFVLLRLIFRRPSLAIVAFVLVLTLFQATQLLNSGTFVWIAAAFQASLIAILTVMVVRYGLLVTAIGFAVGNLLDDIPLTLALSHWSASTSSLSLAVMLTLAGFGFYAARAGQPLFGKIDSMANG